MHAETRFCVQRLLPSQVCLPCRSNADFRLLTRRVVDVETNSLVVTFHRPDLKLPSNEAANAIAHLPPDQKIKAVDYRRPAHTHGVYRAPGFKACAEDRTLPTPTHEHARVPYMSAW